MRYWDRLRDPNKPETRSRSALRPALGSATSQWGQRPMFSEPGPDQPPPDEGRLAPEVQLEGVTPVDESKGSKARTDLIKEEGLARTVLLPISLADVSNPPTTTELAAIFGNPPAGSAGFVIDGGGGLTWFVVKRTTAQWGYELLTQTT